MTGLYRHPKTGMYWVRRKVPQDLRSVIGKGEIHRTTKTKDLAEAKVLAKPIGIEIDRIFADARAGKLRRFSDQDLASYAAHWISEFSRQLESVREIAGERMWIADSQGPIGDPLGPALLIIFRSVCCQRNGLAAN